MAPTHIFTYPKVNKYIISERQFLMTCDEIRLSVELVIVGFLRICRHTCCDWFPGIRRWCHGVLMRLRLKEALLLMSVENLSTGIEASASGKFLNSGDPAVHPAARHMS